MICFDEQRRRPARPAPVLPRGAALGALAVAFSIGLPAAACAQADPTPAAIDEAIDRGTAALLPAVGGYLSEPHREYPMGYLALTLAAVLKGGAPLDHPLVTAAFAHLREMNLEKTYSVACYLFALDAFWQREYRDARRRRRETGRIAETVPRIPPPGPVRAAMERCVGWLARGTNGMWSYGGPGSGDLSNSQFAVLGLEVGLQNEIPVASDVLRGVVRRLLESLARSGAPETIQVVHRTAAWEGITTGRVVARRYTAVPGGWDYRATGGAPSRNMTAAGVSSLLIAGRALRERGAIDAAEWAAVERAVASGLTWLATNLGGFWGDYYGMYSVEKVGDIGGFERLGAADWYREGARYLLRSQARDGSWGNPVNTAFALLFLTRATRPAFQVLGPPVVVTERGEEAPRGRDDGEEDVAYIAALGGFVPVSAVVDFLDETRDPAVIEVAGEALDSLPPHRETQVARWLLLLWSEEVDAVTRFARARLAKLLEAGGGDRERCARAVDELSWLAGLAQAEPPDEDRVARLVREGSTMLVRRRSLEAIDRLGLLGAFEAVIDVLADADTALRERAARLLGAWCGAADVSAGARGPQEARASWERWWRQHGAALRTRRAVDRLVDRCDRLAPNDRAMRDALLGALVELGAGAVPHLVACLERERYPLEVVLALERLTGERRGLRAADWRAP